jgi:hypothetical protein
LISCRSYDKEIDETNPSLRFEDDYNLFSKVNSYDSSLSSSQYFSRISDSTYTINNSKFNLFRLNIHGNDISGYWGLRNDSLLFVPLGFEPCSIEYLIAGPRSSGYYNIDFHDSCFVHKYLGYGSGYSYFLDTINSNTINIGQFIDPGFGTISLLEHLKEVNFLSISISLDYGVICFDYDFANDSIPIIPWVVTDSARYEFQERSLIK